MSADPRLAQLHRLALLVKDRDLARLRRAEAERQALIAALAGLAQPPAAPADLPAHVAAEVALRYERWADQRRREIKAGLQVKSAECEALKAEARQSFGRETALQRLLGQA